MCTRACVGRIFGREVFDGLGGTVPIGLINDNWGGTPVEHWSTPASLKQCGSPAKDSTLYDAMINPYTVGPMAVTGFTYVVDLIPCPSALHTLRCPFTGA